MAQSDSSSRTIDGQEFVVYRLDPTLSYRLARRLGAVLAPSLGAAIGKGSVSSLDSANIDFEKAGREFFDRLDEKLLDDLVQTFGEVSFVDSKKVRDVFAIQFRGKIAQMFEWLAFCLASEYGDIIKKARSGIGRIALLPQAQKSGSPNT